ncbi:Aste57867_14420 [Aphanomyces stellatus]|uniref:Aste57867_14420 protein n=1 Tax=Aphanomyces stellatus TaxID=120398 RepID=A0A485L0K2_9STRA|nr:hypothetical protein As57867_014366 [Aphanomyces stellatus]VFT91242.1 Aste57867_14420 [Aphanomyces stellatus]
MAPLLAFVLLSTVVTAKEQLADAVIKRNPCVDLACSDPAYLVQHYPAACSTWVTSRQIKCKAMCPTFTSSIQVCASWGLQCVQACMEKPPLVFPTTGAPTVAPPVTTRAPPPPPPTRPPLSTKPPPPSTAAATPAPSNTTDDESDTTDAPK